MNVVKSPVYMPCYLGLPFFGGGHQELAPCNGKAVETNPSPVKTFSSKRVLTISVLAIGIILALASLAVGAYAGIALLSGAALSFAVYNGITSLAIGWLGFKFLKNWWKRAHAENSKMGRIVKIIESKGRRELNRHPKVFKIVAFVFFIFATILSLLCFGLLVGTGGRSFISICELGMSLIGSCWITAKAYKVFRQRQLYESALLKKKPVSQNKFHLFNWHDKKILLVSALVVGIFAVLSALLCFNCLFLGLTLGLIALKSDQIIFFVVNLITSTISAKEAIARSHKYI